HYFALAYRYNGQHEKVLDILKRAIPEYPEMKIDLLIEQAQTYQRMGNPQMEMQTYEEILRIEPDNANVSMRMAQAMIRRGMYQQATDHLKRLLQQEPVDEQHRLSRSEHLCLLGKSHLESGQYNLAHKYLQESVNLNPGNSRALFELARNHRFSGRFEKAIACYKQALRYNRNLKWTLLELSFCYQDTSEFRRCTKELAVHYPEIRLAWSRLLPDVQTVEQKKYLHILETDLERIIHTSRSRNACVILQNYPGNEEISRFLAGFATRENIN
ncbi:unnamed protein product, partial [marine sediment metagenome]